MLVAIGLNHGGHSMPVTDLTGLFVFNLLYTSAGHSDVRLS